MYRDAKGVKRDYKRAIDWFGKAGERAMRSPNLGTGITKVKEYRKITKKQ